MINHSVALVLRTPAGRLLTGWSSSLFAYICRGNIDRCFVCTQIDMLKCSPFAYVISNIATARARNRIPAHLHCRQLQQKKTPSHRIHSSGLQPTAGSLVWVATGTHVCGTHMLLINIPMERVWTERAPVALTSLYTYTHTRHETQCRLKSAVKRETRLAKIVFSSVSITPQTYGRCSRTYTHTDHYTEIYLIGSGLLHENETQCQRNVAHPHTHTRSLK